jgi:hypothetical protein
MKTGRRLLLAAAVALPAATAWSQSARVPTVTRLVKVFLDLEAQLAQAAHGNDVAALRALLADDFEMRVAQRPGVPTPRAEWLAALARQPAPAAEIEQIAAHDHGAVVDVSFLLRPAEGAPLFIVDTWAKVGDGWRLQVRYAAPVARAVQRVPGEGDEAVIPKKY